MSTPLKPGYKQTEVGVIPAKWDAAPLAAVCAMKSGAGIMSANIDEFSKYPCYGGNGLRGFSSRFTHSGGYALIGRQGALCGNVLGVEGTFFASEHAIVVTAFSQTDIRWLTYVLGEMHLNQYSESSAQPGLSVAKLLHLDLAVPPTRAEQRAIAAALSDVDALLGALDQLIAKKRDLKQAAMQQLLTGQTRLPGFHGEWKIKSLLDIADLKKELFDDGDWIEAEFLTENGIRLIQTGNIGEGQFTDKESKKYISADSFKKLGCKELLVGDILICRLADPAGRACILPDIGEARMITAVDVTIFRPPSDFADRRYLVNVFNTPSWFVAVNERCGGSTRTRIARGQLGKMEIKLPPIAEQTAIAEVLTDLDAGLAALEQRRAKTRALKQGMMQELLTGRVRLR